MASSRSHGGSSLGISLPFSYALKPCLVYKPDTITVTSPLVDKFSLTIMPVLVTFPRDFRFKPPDTCVFAWSFDYWVSLERCSICFQPGWWPTFNANQDPRLSANREYKGGGGGLRKPRRESTIFPEKKIWESASQKSCGSKCWPWVSGSHLWHIIKRNFPDCFRSN